MCTYMSLGTIYEMNSPDTNEMNALDTGEIYMMLIE